jgi:hypothetical protein
MVTHAERSAPGCQTESLPTFCWKSRPPPPQEIAGSERCRKNTIYIIPVEDRQAVSGKDGSFAWEAIALKRFLKCV